VWLTRPTDPGGQLRSRLKGEGFHSVHVPVLTVDLVDPPELTPDPDWIVFVSANAVSGLTRAMKQRGLTPGAGTTRVAAIGRKTAEVARASGWNMDLVPFVERAEGLLDALAPFPMQGARVLVPCGNREGSATTLIPERLTRSGAVVDRVQVYETLDRALPSNETAELARWSPGAVLLYSPSAVDAWLQAVKSPAIAGWSEAETVAIGPTTGARLESRGLSPIVCPEPTPSSVITALCGVPRLRADRETS